MVERATVFGAEAEAYDKVRPTYPADVIDMIVAESPELVIDVGCGTGLAARQVVDRNVKLIGVEPDPKMAAIARSHGIDVSVTKLEDWDPIYCDVLYAAQSWHWVDPSGGAEVAAKAIRPRGRWLACWNLEVDANIDAVCETVYREIAPDLASDRAVTYLDDQRFEQRIAAGLQATGCFEQMSKQVVHWIDHIDGRRLADRLDSHSAHRMLTNERRSRVRSALTDAFGIGNELRVSYRTDVFSARRL